MDTPIFDFVQQYQASGTVRLHMPGHKGQPVLGCEPFDITEIAGADNLQMPEMDGIIAKSEANATALFGTSQTYYSAGGSSACISAMLYLAKLAAPTACAGRILAGRNAHKVFLQACGLLDIQPSWLYPAPQDAQGVCGCDVSPIALHRALAVTAAQDAMPMAVYITSPDYLGNVADVAGLANVCKQYDVPLLVDNAHGAYLKFLPKEQPYRHPMESGAAMCCDSAHKTLPVLTGGAYLHIAQGQRDAQGELLAAMPQYSDVKAALSLFSSTSPSYLILQSLDLCNAYLAKAYAAELATCVAQLAQCKEMLAAHGYVIRPSEPLKLVVDMRGCTATLEPDEADGKSATVVQSGEALADYLRTQGIEPEFADLDFLVCMVTPQNTVQDFARLQHALLALSSVSVLIPKEVRDAEGARREGACFAPHQTACGVREALFSTGETIPVENAAGKICRMPSVSCPPAIPIVVSGEIITDSDLKLFEYYGIETVNVIKEKV